MEEVLLLSFHDRIKEARKQKQMTQEELGSLIGVAKTTIAGYEKNREPTAAQLGAIADALETDVDFLLQDEVKVYRKESAYTEQEEELLRNFRGMNDQGHDKVMSYVEDLVASGRYQAMATEKGMGRR